MKVGAVGNRFRNDSVARLARRVFVYLDDLRNGDRRLRCLPEVEGECSRSQNALLSLQWRRLQRIIDTAYEHVPFYRARFSAAGLRPRAIQTPSDLPQLPVLQRSDIRNNQVGLRNPAYGPHEVLPTATGGTTDSPVSLVLDRDCWANRRAATLYFARWYGYELGDRVALLWGARQDSPIQNTLKGHLRQWLTGPTLWLPSSYLNDEVLGAYYRTLVAFHPKVLQAYPTPLYLLACFMERNGLRAPVPYINVVAEYLYDYQRDKIESVFGTKLFNWYGARELGHIATECRVHDGMHINTHGVYIEVIKDGKPVEGEIGELVITDLWNRAMPLIRYKIGDLGAISYRKCPCGSELPLISEVGGRYVDTFKKRDGTCIPGVAFTNRIIKDDTGIVKLQIVQKDYETFELNVVKGERYEDTQLEALKRRLAAFMQADLVFRVNFVDDILSEKSGKTLFCKSEVGTVAS